MYSLIDSDRVLQTPDETMVAEPMAWPSKDWLDTALARYWPTGWPVLDRRLLGKLLAPAITAVIIVVALLVLHATLKEVRFADVWLALTSIKLTYMAGALVLVALSYLFLTGYDQLCLTFLRKKVPYPIVALGSFISYAFANNLGFALLTGGSVRYRVFSRHGVSTGDVAIITVMSAVTFILAATLVMGTCLLIVPESLAAMTGLPIALNVLFGTVLLTGLGIYIGWVASRPNGCALTWGRWSIDLPGAGSTVGQLLVGCGDIFCAAAALYILLPASTDVSYFVFVGIFAAAITLGLISSVPGGVGVFEGIILFAVPNATADQLIASLLAFRLVYYIVPLLASLALLLWYEAQHAQASAGWRMALRGMFGPRKAP